MSNQNDLCYEKALGYWADIPPTVDGVLGGFGFISDMDIDGSKLFLKSLFSLKNPPASHTALDCGAGIGRITKYLLLPYFQSVDVIEPDEKFLNTITDFVGEERTKLGNFYNVGLQKFKPDKKYDVIWNQWVLGYLTDKDLISFLQLCRNALSENGVIVIKENVTSSGKLEKDETDSSVTRSLKQFLKIFKTANLRRIKQCKQTNFPNGIYPVYMFALVPKINELICNNIQD
ncbi:N-terminal Xaa-Pro-Lys N-methyltransferase 1-A [Galleria mellonella]|uniref:Alpha N-terminal protein methyltransferase 1 n=1 Tax=Galleria mellonella TaxID=7137 RepID=A0A6J1WHI3_GALME|nr:N-terminal Xaa-Pro-Lys N-methyltransferase 1-A [Galleria mellonella]